MGINWGLTLIALVCLVLVPVPFLFYKYGTRIRQRSQYAPCIVSVPSAGLIAKAQLMLLMFRI